MIPVPRILDSVVAILKAASRPLVAREICEELSRKGVNLERTKLTQILWNQNDRSELVVDKNTFKWRYDPDAASRAEEAERRKAETRREVAKHAAFLEFWEQIGFEFIGVRRKNTEKPFFFLREDDDYYWIIGPAGNLLRERSSLCSRPESLLPGEFTLDQVKKAAEEILKERKRKAIANAHAIITFLRDTQVPPDDVYIGPAVSRVDDVIPVSGIIFVGNVSGLESCTLTLGWGTVLAPVFLVVNILGLGVNSDTRYGVFKICVYELIKQGLATESDGDLNLRIYLESDRVYIGTEEINLYLKLA
jgi:hypothetical protein